MLHTYIRFLQTPEEEKIYFNVDKDLRLRKLEQFYQAGVRKIFCGHYHRLSSSRCLEIYDCFLLIRNAGGFYKDLEVVVTSGRFFAIITFAFGTPCSLHDQ